MVAALERSGRKRRKNMSLHVANTIRDQIGQVALRMIGARDLVGSERGLSFRIGSGAPKRATHVRVTLDPSDTYTVTACQYSKRALEMRTLSEESGLCWDSLRDSIERQTGFYTRF
jgi:hypothetical protein